MRTFSAIIGARVPQSWAERMAGWRARPGALVWQPEPPVKGSAAAGRRLMRGVLLFDGRLVETQAPLPWDLDAPDATWTEHLHGHAWLDDAASADDPAVWDHLNAWVWAWLDRFGSGGGPGWRPDLVARRLIRQIAHSPRLLRGVGAERSEMFFRALDRQTRFLSWRWQTTRPGIERVEALAGLVYALISLEGHSRKTATAIADLGKVADQTVGHDGSVRSRDPEELARVVTMLVWAADGLEDAGQKPDGRHLAALQRAAPAVRMLRHPDGTLARFHGGRSGQDLPLDEMLLRAARRGIAPGATGSAMGYLRLSAGPALCLIDAAAPTRPETCHSSALAFEFSHGANHVVVQSGSGLGFGARSARASRRLPAHSSVEVAGQCPASVVRLDTKREAEALRSSGQVTGRLTRERSGLWALCNSAQYVEALGLTIERRLHLHPDGNRLSGEDTVLATDARSRARVAQQFPEKTSPCAITARFHLHPDVRATLALAGRAVALTLADGSRWMMRADADKLGIEASQYFDETRPKPRATLQIVARGHVIEYWGRISWSFERIASDSRAGLTPE